MPDYDSFVVEETDDGFSVLQADEDIFDYIGRVVIEDEKIIFEESYGDGFRPVQEVYTEPDRFEIRLYTAVVHLISLSELPDIEIFSENLHGTLTDELA